MEEIWKALARTEMLLQLMTQLVKLKVGFAEVEEFNLGIKGNLKNPMSEKISEMQDSKIVKAAMEVKMRDEQVTKRKLIRARNKARAELSRNLGRNSKRYRTQIRCFQERARKEKVETRIKYTEKLEHLKRKYRENDEEKLDKVPAEVEEFATLSIFDREMYARLRCQTYEPTCVGDLTVSDGEKEILQMQPNFSLVEDLKEGGLDFDLEIANAKLRITIQKELDEKVDDDQDEVELTQEEEDALEEQEARTRMTFDPINKIFDDRKRRVTDLDECNRVTLPRPLPTNEETLIGMRRSIHTINHKMVKSSFS